MSVLAAHFDKSGFDKVVDIRLFILCMTEEGVFVRGVADPPFFDDRVAPALLRVFLGGLG